MSFHAPVSVFLKVMPLGYLTLTGLSLNNVRGNNLLLCAVQNLLRPGDLHHLGAYVGLITARQDGLLIRQGEDGIAGGEIHEVCLYRCNWKR